jgi:hypothetical protein
VIKSRLRILLPIIAILILLIYCWTIILTTDIIATWRHYLGLILFLPIIYLFFKSKDLVLISTGIYLLLATFNLLALNAEITIYGISFGPLTTPPIQLLSLGLFTIYFILNLDPLIDIFLSFEENRKQKK